MTECKVICTDCATTVAGPKTWLWLCETCAEECLDTHRRDTGHTNIELRVTQAFAADTIGARIKARRADFVARKYGW